MTAGTPHVMHDADGLVVVAEGCCLVNYFHVNPTVEAFEALERVERAIVAEHGAIALISIIDDIGINMPRAAREKATALANEFDGRTLAQVSIVLGTGARAAVVRSIIGAIQLAGRAKAPWRVFGEDISGVVPWVTEQLGAAGRGVDPVALSLAMNTALSLGIEAKQLHEQGRAAPAEGRVPRQLGRFTLEKLLGVGGMAEVFLASQAGSGGPRKELVVKTMLPHLARDPAYVKMFHHEARVASQLDHPNLVRVFDAGNLEGVNFIAMEYVAGASLLAVCRRAWAKELSVPIGLVAAVGADAAAGLHHAHQAGLVHRDVSPDNLLVTTEGVGKVVDFGIAKSGHQSLRTSTGVVKGKIPFMAPEQLANAPVDGRADLYALGATLYWALTQERPFQAADDATLMARILREPAPTVRDKNPAVPQALAEIVSCLLEKSPERRFSDGEAVARALRAAVAGDRDAIGAFVAARAAEPDPLEEVLTATVPGVLPQELPRAPSARPRRSLLPVWGGAAVLVVLALGALLMRC